jgi:hypothetical protein
MKNRVQRRSPLAAILVAMSLVFQLIAASYHQALAISSGPSNAAIAAELRANFGDAAALCVHSDDNSPPVSPAGDCDDHCPFCRFAAQTVALVAPDTPALPVRLDATCLTIVAAPETGALPVCPTKRSRARAPPFGN